jgi:uncharacterized protein YndB with AHSA1/START domain
MGRTRVQLTETVYAPRELVFERLTNHEDMRNWPGVGDCRLVAEGSPRNGLGAVRAVKSRGLTLHEKVVRFDPPTGYDYKIIKGLPVDHLGTVRLEDSGSGVRINWTIEMSSRIPLLAQVVGVMLKRGLPSALSYFKRETEKAAS